MPTYSACGVTATLSLADLETSVTKTVDTRPGALNRDGKRIEQVFAAGKPLLERPIGSDGSETGVMQFIGEDENLPCFVVEASEHSRPRVTRDETRESSGLPAFAPPNLRKEGSSMNMTDSPLTSLAATPSTEARSTMLAPSRRGTPSKVAPSLAAHGTGRESSESFASNRIEGLPLHQLSTPQALVLEVQTCRKSFPQKINRKRGDMRFPDMKIELFLNGQLADSHFINYQRSGTDHKHKFSGTRIHKQIAKPWIYQALGQGESSDLTAAQRWAGISALLVDHVKTRGVDKRDQLSPIAQYLSALSSLALPDRLKDCANLGVLDVIITTGKGSKQGPIHGYLTSPRAMLSTKYDAGTPEDINELEDDPFVDTQLPDHSTSATTVSSSENMSAPVSFNALPTASQVADTSELSSEHLAQIPPSTSPAIPLARRTRSAAVEDNTVPPVQEPVDESLQVADAQPKSKIQIFADKLGIPPDKMSMARQWHSKRGKPSMCKTITERLNDIRKMSVENQEVAIAEVLEAISSSDASASPVKAEPPRKRARKDSRVHQDEHVSMQDVEDDPIAMEAQQRMHMLIDQGATPDGRLASRVSSLSAHRQPTKKTALSPPVMAPPPVLGKLVPQDSGPSLEKKKPSDCDTEALGRTPSILATPQKEEQSKRSEGKPAQAEATMTPLEQESLLGETPQPMSISPKKKSKARSRAASTPALKPSPDESTGEEALAAFQPPELCRGSVLTYAGPGMQRQTTKSRPGIFDEDELVVGMRFVVV
ncbi:unnamed protein product [Zymoseptoria tritici ST99CH_1A5]|uniref:Uncharacterized protein n=1 Tax=Zymoseptoria tritici ST99CH_1A5 TaxID=1276529 RepID=A0A1Y6LG39_ZYMTR|nr:unnamed protein product [Zymoseptoria tritici ST99CH_1A5]